MSLISNDAHDNVKFVSYTGEYPNLCQGVLTLEIKGETYRFGHDYNNRSWKTDGNYDKFWKPGGKCDFWGNSIVTKDEWEIDVSALPKEIRQFVAEIDEVFNANVPQGCCGGCM